jgi:N-acetylglucosamine-6-phosphate deacetylase
MIFTARQLLTSDGVLKWPRIDVGFDGTIESIEVGDPGSDETTIVPAFFDGHVHGAAGHDVMEGTPEALGQVGQFLATCGVGHYLATTVTASVEETLRALDGIASVIEAQPASLGWSGWDGGPTAARPMGIHLEGPFISHTKRGVHPPAQIQEPSVALFERFQEAARGQIKLITIAPEMPGALELIAYAAREGVRASLGHSDATAAEARAGIAAGATSATHTFNAMRRLDHREPGIAGVVLDAEELFAELICDGIHVAPEFVRMWLWAKGVERGILVTDGISATGMPDGQFMLGGFPVTVSEGRCLLSSDLERGVETLAGSVLTMDQAVENLQRLTGASLETAVRLASRNPATMLGMDGLGEVAVGRPANFSLYSGDGVLISTMLGGRVV